MYVYTLLVRAEEPIIFAMLIPRLNTIVFALCGFAANCCFSSSLRGIRFTMRESPILPRNIAGIVSRTSSGIAVSAVNFNSLGTVMYRTPLLLRPTSVVLRSTALSIMESLMVATWFANGFSGTPRLANCTSPDLVFFNVSTFQLAPFLSASLASVKAFAPSFVPTYT